MPPLSDILNWLTHTPLGVAATIALLILAFVGVAAISERKTRRMYPDKSRRKTGRRR